MTKKLLFVFLILFAGSAGLFAAELSGTYDKDYTVRTDFNTIAAGKTLHVTNGATYVMRDAIVHGSIIVDKGCKFISPDDYEGYLVFKPGTHVEGIDLYYKVRVSDSTAFTRKIPMTLDEVWKSKNQELIDLVGNMEFCYSPELKGWVTINEIRFVNPFNENLYDNFDIVFTKSESRIIEGECNSLIVKNKSKAVIQPDPGVWGTKIHESIIVESGSSLLGTDANGHKLVLKKGVKIQGLSLYVRYNNDYKFVRLHKKFKRLFAALTESEIHSILFKTKSYLDDIIRKNGSILSNGPYFERVIQKEVNTEFRDHNIDLSDDDLNQINLMIFNEYFNEYRGACA